MKRKFLFAFTIIIFQSIINFSQDLSLDTIFVKANHFDMSSLWSSKPFENLPEYIPIFNDSIYLYADYTDFVNATIPIYIINNTKDKFEYNGYLMSLLQQEFKDSSNNWRRSQSLFYGWCGTGYSMEDGIRPGEYTTVRKSFRYVGEKHDVRYNFFNTGIAPSNQGIGRVILEEVEKAEYDDVALKTNGAEFLIKIIEGEIAPFETEEENETLVRRAIPYFAWYYPEEAVPLLQVLAKDSTSKYQRQSIANLEGIEKRKQKK